MSILNEEFETWMCGHDDHKGPCPPEGCPKGQCARAARGVIAGNLTVAYPGAIKDWDGCYDKDCLPACDLRKNHCERLKLFLEQSNAGCGQAVIEPWRDR